MNLFILDKNPIIAAQMYQDLHVNKIVIEGAQMLATAYTLERLAENDVPRTQKGLPRRHSHKNHPMTKWVVKNASNYKWTLDHIMALCHEYTYRSGKTHFTQQFVEWCGDNLPDLPIEPQSMHPQCFEKSFPECIVDGNPVQGYQNYYNAAKTQFKFGKKMRKATWTRRNPPSFFKPA